MKYPVGTEVYAILKQCKFTIMGYMYYEGLLYYVGFDDDGDYFETHSARVCSL